MRHLKAIEDSYDAKEGMNAFYRDVQNVLRHVVRLWFYLSPGLWTVAGDHSFLAADHWACQEVSV